MFLGYDSKGFWDMIAKVKLKWKWLNYEPMTSGW